MIRLFILCLFLFFHSAVNAQQNHGWVVGNSGKIITSSNEGTTWNNQTTGVSNNLYSVYFVSISTGWTVGTLGRILKTTNSGIDWSSQNSGTSDNLYSICFVNENIGWTVGQFGRVMKTTNGGTSWSNQSSGKLGQSLFGVFCK